MLTEERQVIAQNQYILRTRLLSVAYMIKDDSIVNADVNSAAEIVKLDMNAPTTRADAVGIAQADPDWAFDADDFDVTDGWVTLKAGRVDLADIEEIADLTALEIYGASAITEVPSSTGGNDSLFLQRAMVKLELLLIIWQIPIMFYNPRLVAQPTALIGGATIFEATGTSDITAEFGASIDIDDSGANTQYFTTKLLLLMKDV